MANENKSMKTPGLRERMHKGVDKMMDKSDSMNRGGRKMMANIKAKAIKMRDNVDEYIRKNPKKTVMYAAGAGATVGVITTAAIRKKHKNQSHIG